MAKPVEYDEAKGMTPEQLGRALEQSQEDAAKAEAAWLKQHNGKGDRVVIGETDSAVIWIPREDTPPAHPPLSRRMREKERDRELHGQRESMRSYLWDAAIRQYEAELHQERVRAIRQLFDQRVDALEDDDMRKHCRKWQKDNPVD